MVVYEASATAPLKLCNDAVEMKPYRVLFQIGPHFHKVSGPDTSFLNLTLLCSNRISKWRLNYTVSKEFDNNHAV